MDLIKQYIIALTNLYGQVPAEKVVEIYNSQNETKVSIKEVENLLINPPEELEKVFVYPHEGYFVHETVLAFDDFEKLMTKKADKPYYIPKKEELLKYAVEEYYEENKQFKDLFRYIKKNFIPDEEKARELVNEIHGMCQVKADMTIIMDSFNTFNVSFNSMDQVNEVLQLVTGVANNIRLWQNNGHTPQEIFEKFEKPNLKPLPDKPFVYNAGEQTVVKEEKIGRNDPCPCGSGKKYKKCCLGKDEKNK